MTDATDDVSLSSSRLAGGTGSGVAAFSTSLSGFGDAGFCTALLLLEVLLVLDSLRGRRREYSRVGSDTSPLMAESDTVCFLSWVEVFAEDEEAEDEEEHNEDSELEPLAESVLERRTGPLDGEWDFDTAPFSSFGSVQSTSIGSTAEESVPQLFITGRTEAVGFVEAVPSSAAAPSLGSCLIGCCWSRDRYSVMLAVKPSIPTNHYKNIKHELELLSRTVTRFKI